jgi:hypothetical protein
LDKDSSGCHGAQSSVMGIRYGRILVAPGVAREKKRFIQRREFIRAREQSQREAQ